MPRTRKNPGVARSQIPSRMSRERQAWRIRKRLDVLGWKDRHLARQIGMLPADLSKLLKTDTPHARKRSLEAWQAWVIARAIGLTETYILFGDRRGIDREVMSTLPPEED